MLHRLTVMLLLLPEMVCIIDVCLVYVPEALSDRQHFLALLGLVCDHSGMVQSRDIIQDLNPKWIKPRGHQHIYLHETCVSGYTSVTQTRFTLTSGNHFYGSESGMD